jgi:hypothetical protein
MNLLCRHPHLSKAIEELDDEEVPDSADDDWFRE